MDGLKEKQNHVLFMEKLERMEDVKLELELQFSKEGAND